ncbi:MAG: DUF748 domain-containing protein [Bacteroidota bacterium]|nr:DUF748 domain-containing protein [Bacteroidota bacterium]
MKKKYVILATVVVLIGLLLFSLSSIAKWYVVRHSEEIIGRRIQIKELHINYLRASARIVDFVMYESNKTDTFASFHEFYINFDPLALFSKNYAFSEIRLIKPYVVISQFGNKFNFDDLLSKRDTTQKTSKDTSVFHYFLKNIHLSGGKIRYIDKKINNHVNLSNLNIDIPSLAWNSTQSDMGIVFKIGEKGQVSLKTNLNNQSRNYLLDIYTRNINLSMITNYLKNYANITALKGVFSSNLKIKGNLDHLANLSLTGSTRVDQLDIHDATKSSIFSVSQIAVNLKQIDLALSHFHISDITLVAPHIAAVLSREKTNIEKFLSPLLAANARPQPVPEKLPAKTGKKEVTYTIDALKIKDGTILFHDLTLNRPFSYDLRNINLRLTKLNQSSTQVPLLFSINLNNKGNLKGKGSLNMKNPKIFNVLCEISKMDLVSLSPYSEYYLASPVTQGKFNYRLSLDLKPTSLTNQNNIVIYGLKFGKRTKDKTATKLPVKLALYILKDAKNKISIDLPVKGNPSDPKFSLKKIIWKTLSNFLVKVATEPFRALSKLVGTNPDKIKEIPYSYGADSLDEDQNKNLHNIAELMRKKPDLKFSFTQYNNVEEEKQTIAVQHLKAQFLKSQKPEIDSAELVSLAQKLSTTDHDFENYITKRSPDATSVGMEKACLTLTGDQLLNNQLSKKMTQRNGRIKKFLTEQENVPLSSFQIETADLRNIPEKLKKPVFKVEVFMEK